MTFVGISIVAKDLMHEIDGTCIIFKCYKLLNLICLFVSIFRE